VQVSLASSKRQPFRLAYAVGRHLVSAGVAGTQMSCKRTERLPARTAIGWSQDRKQLILVVIDHWSKLHLHGVEPDQMAQIMRDLGAYEAYMFDGGGSTEMVVRPKPGAKVSIRNHPSDGRERRIPIGFGIYRR
jgi:exopolysaccharide biosynthesis protein